MADDVDHDALKALLLEFGSNDEEATPEEREAARLDQHQRAEASAQFWERHHKARRRAAREAVLDQIWRFNDGEDTTITVVPDYEFDYQ